VLLNLAIDGADINRIQRKDWNCGSSIRQIKMVNGLAIVTKWARRVMVLLTVLVGESVMGGVLVALVKQRMEQMHADRQIKNGQGSQP